MQWLMHSKTSHVRITEEHEKDRMGKNAFLPAQEFRKMTYRERRNRGRWLTGNREISEDDLRVPGPGQFHLMTSRNPPGPGKSSSMISWLRKVILLNLKSGFDETSCLKSSSGDKRFRLFVSQNCLGPGKSSSGDWKSQQLAWVRQSHLRNP